MTTAPLTTEEQFESLKHSVDAFHAACAPHLKEGEGIVERMERYHTETQGLLGELAKERLRAEALKGENDALRAELQAATLAANDERTNNTMTLLEVIAALREQLAEAQGHAKHWESKCSQAWSERDEQIAQRMQADRQLAEARRKALEPLQWMADPANWNDEDCAIKRRTRSGEQVGIFLHSWGLKPWVFAQECVRAFINQPDHPQTDRCGFDRNGSQSNGTYTCTCGWIDQPEEVDSRSRLKRIASQRGLPPPEETDEEFAAQIEAFNREGKPAKGDAARDARRYRWQPIETAPRDNKQPLLLAEFNGDGELRCIDHDGRWDYETSGWEEGYQRSYFWASAYGYAEEPTHWMYQPDWYDKLQQDAIDSTMRVLDAPANTR